MERLYILFQQMSNSKTSADITIASYLCITLIEIILGVKYKLQFVDRVTGDCSSSIA
jgi:hypothetical protein